LLDRILFGIQLVAGCIHVICRRCARLEEAKVPGEVGFACPFCSRKCAIAADKLVVDVGTVARLQEQEQQQQLVGRRSVGNMGGFGMVKKAMAASSRTDESRKRGADGSERTRSGDKRLRTDSGGGKVAAVPDCDVCGDDPATK
jgi:hypothetical protein